MVTVVWFGGLLILGQTPLMDASSFIAYIALFYSIINPAKQFSTALYSIQKGAAAMDRIDQILNAESTILEPEQPKPLNGFNKEIEYRNVSFAYRPDRVVLKDVNVKIGKGQTVALVGQSGSGKSTFVDLLPRFYDVIKGEILIDGINIKDVSLHGLRELMGNVNQDPILFNDTIFNNIAFGVESATREEVEPGSPDCQCPRVYHANRERI